MWFSKLNLCLNLQYVRNLLLDVVREELPVMIEIKYLSYLSNIILFMASINLLTDIVPLQMNWNSSYTTFKLHVLQSLK